MTTLPDITDIRTETPIFTLRLSPSGVGYLSWSIRKQPRASVRKATADIPESLASEEAKPGPASSATKERKAAARRKNKLDNLLFNVSVDMSLEAFCLFDLTRHHWFVESPEDSDTKWTLDRRGKPNLERLLKNFRGRIERAFTLGWFFYRWELRRGRAYGQPILKFHLLGDPGPDHSLDEAGDIIREAWLDLIKSDNPDLVGVRVPPENASLAFSAPTDFDLAPDLANILQRQREFGRIHLKNIPIEKPKVCEPPAEVIRQVVGILAAHHRQYSEDAGRDVSQSYLDSLSKLSGRACINATTSPEVQELLAPYLLQGS